MMQNDAGITGMILKIRNASLLTALKSATVAWPAARLGQKLIGRSQKKMINQKKINNRK